MRRMVHGVLLPLMTVVVWAGCKSEAERERDRKASRPASAVVVSLTPRQIALTGIETESVTVTIGPETFATTGEIEFDPARVVTVNAAVAGRVRRLLVNVGDQVQAGDTLATIESPDFLSGTFPVLAPRAGVVTNLSAAPLQAVSPGAELLRVAAVDRVWLRVDLYGEQVALVRAGLAVQASVDAFPGWVLEGRIAAVAPSVDGATQAAAARVPLENPSGRLRPGMFVDVRVRTGRTVRGLLVPRDAVIYDGGRRLVMIAQDSTFFPSVVTIGAVVGERVVVLRGVRPGERVVTRGGYELYSAGYAFVRGAGEEGEEGERR